MISYEGEADGIPLARGVEFFYEDRKTGERTSDESVRVEKLFLEPAPPEDFALSSFGIP